MVDGLIGQGLKIIVLITTNEELGKLHPAVTRRGRCLASTAFLPFDPESASGWLAASGMESRVQAPTVLANLYGVASGGDHVVPQPKVGFAA